MDKYTLDNIKLITSNILNDSTQILSLSNNTKHLIRNEMINILKKTDEFSTIIKLKDLVFLLMTRSISNLRIPYNKKKMILVIQHHMNKNINENMEKLMIN